MQSSVTVLTEDGKTVPIPDELLPQLTLLRGTAGMGAPEGGAGGARQMQLPKVSSATLSKVLEYASLHLLDPTVSPEALRQKGGVVAAERSRVRLTLSHPRSATGLDGDDDDDDEAISGGQSSDESAGDDDGMEEDVSAFLLEEQDDLVCPADRKFAQALDIPGLLDLTQAANFLAMEGLLDLCCKTLAGHMTGLSVAELRQKFNIPNDFTPEEEAQMQAEYGWADE